MWIGHVKKTYQDRGNVVKYASRRTLLLVTLLACFCSLGWLYRCFRANSTFQIPFDGS